jgi:tRNA nucleotidyltransferase (CCA-adding enzyme)
MIKDPRPMPAAVEIPDARELAARVDALPGIAEVRAALAGEPAYLVGGALRDVLRGLSGADVDVDVAVEGDAIALARRAGTLVRAHERFGTATVEVAGARIDLAMTRRERYPEPGALPEVEPADIAADLARRDFTVNAMAFPLTGERRLLDPYGGARDLSAGVLRVLHPGSLRDDPTRALRAARYAARLGAGLEPETERLVRAADLSAVSADRVEAELRLIAAEERAIAALELLADWGLAGIERGGPERARAALAVLNLDGWEELDHRVEVVLAGALGDAERVEGAKELAAARPERPSEAARLARGRDPVELVLARANGAEWLDPYVREWRDVRLEITGADLLATGVPEGPAIGRGLAAALDAKLDEGVRGREAELAVALAAAGS